MLGMDAAPATARAESDSDNVLTEALVLRDPDIPAAGNVGGDITIVEYFDYQCPYCRKIAPDLRQVVHDDGKVRLVLKDWPILGPISIVASRMALASKYQDKYVQAHEALIGLNSKLTEPKLREALAGAGIDVDRLNHDLVGNAKTIDAILARNDDQAKAFGFSGHAVLYRRKVSRAGRTDDGRVRSGHCRCAKSGGKQIAATAIRPARVRRSASSGSPDSFHGGSSG